jgi:hypothetical protein
MTKQMVETGNKSNKNKEELSLGLKKTDNNNTFHPTK